MSFIYLDAYAFQCFRGDNVKYCGCSKLLLKRKKNNYNLKIMCWSIHADYILNSCDMTEFYVHPKHAQNTSYPQDEILRRDPCYFSSGVVFVTQTTVCTRCSSVMLLEFFFFNQYWLHATGKAHLTPNTPLPNIDRM